MDGITTRELDILLILLDEEIRREEFQQKLKPDDKHLEASIKFRLQIYRPLRHKLSEIKDAKITNNDNR